MSTISIGSYFNPLSNQHHAIEQFRELKGWQKVVTGALTGLVTLLTLPILGLGGVAVYRALVRQFSATYILIGEGFGPVHDTAAKTNKYIMEMGRIFKDEGKTLVDEEDYKSLASEKDTLFKLLSHTLDVSTEEIRNRLKEYIEANHEKVEQFFESNFQIHSKNFNIDLFKEFLVDDNLLATLVKKYRKNNPSVVVLFQDSVQRLRCECLSLIFDIRIVTNRVSITHPEGAVISKNLENTIFSEDGQFVIKLFEPRSFGNEEAERTIELTYGILGNSDVEHGRFNTTFIQPRKLENAEQ